MPYFNISQTYFTGLLIFLPQILLISSRIHALGHTSENALLVWYYFASFKYHPPQKKPLLCYNEHYIAVILSTHKNSYTRWMNPVKYFIHVDKA